ncbi:hypothetical protein [Microcoleus sp.]|uniref:hypothetical protein n=1 Tax=Microcoleus sp. TaxID=44472 RepID=UPI00403ED074
MIFSEAYFSFVTMPQARFLVILVDRLLFVGVAELRYDLCGQGMFWLPDLPRLRAIEIIGWMALLAIR